MPEFRFFCLNVLPDFIKTIPKYRAIEDLMSFNLSRIKVNLNHDDLVVFVNGNIPSYEIRIGNLPVKIQYLLLNLIPHGNSYTAEFYSGR